MSIKSAIEWTEATWNPVTGCTKISPGCGRCYAERLSKRLQAMGQRKYRNGFNLTLHPDTVEEPLQRKKPTVYFVNSMSDLFHADVPADFIRQVFDVMGRASWHTFQVLTKRPERAAELAAALDWPPNVWMGTSIENQDYLWRCERLLRLPAAVLFLSLEPLLGPIRFDNLVGIDWVIVGGESGPKARPMQPDWVRQVRTQCVRFDVPFFFKQWGAYGADGIKRAKSKNGRRLDGRTWDEFPRRKVPC